MGKRRLPPSDEWRCVRCHWVLPSPADGRAPVSCLYEVGGCGRGTTWCEHDSPVEGCEPCKEGYTRFFPAAWDEARVELYIKAEMDPYRPLIDFYCRTFRMEDVAPLDVSLAAILTAGWEGEPLWGFIVAPPSSGKTATLQIFQKDRDGTIFRNTLTPHALVSGLKRQHQDLLPRLDGKCLVIKDFTSILTMHREGRDEILGDLRAIFDGDFSKSFGSDVGDKEYVARFNLLAAVTPVIELHYTVDSIVGQRFFMVRMALPPEYDSDAEREPEAIKAELQEKLLELLKARRADNSRPRLSEDQVRECKGLAGEVATLRTEVPRDSKGDLKMMPSKEGPVRLANQFEKIACGVAFARGHAEVLEEDIEIVRRVARDTVPSVRREVLVAVTAGPMTVRDVCAITRLGDWEARRKLEDLHILDVLAVKEESQVRFYETKQDFLLFRAKLPVGTPGLEIPIWSKHGSKLSGPPSDVHPKLTGAPNIKAISDHVRNKLRWDGGRPDSWIVRDAILAFQLPEDSASDLEVLVASMRKGMAE